MADPTPRTEQRKRRQRRRFFALCTVVVVLLVAAAGVFLVTRDGDSEQAATTTSSTGAATSTTTSTTTTLPKVASGLSASYAALPLRSAVTKGGDVPVYATPDPNTAPMSSLSAQTEYTLPRSFLAFDQYQDWLHVYLPTRPNGSTAWVKESDVTVSQPLEYQIKVTLADHKVTLLHNGAVESEAPAAIGTGDTPTPTGTFYYTDPLDLATQPGTGYGVFAIGLSGHSNVLQTFAGGDGQIAIHGTDDEGTIGESVSHGCVRVDNSVILKLSTLPLGTPVVIT